MDVRAALILGRVVRPWEPVEVSTEGLGDVWADVVLGLDMSVVPPRLRGLAGLVDGTESEITARFDSQGACGHAIRAGDRIGYSKRHGCRCAGCWEKWKGENAAAAQDEAFYASQY